MKRSNLFLVFIINIVFSTLLFGVQKGSESLVAIEQQANFPSGDLDNKMLAFGWFKNGFNLEDATTSCTFESIFPVAGSVTLNGGTLYLESDLHLANVTTFTSLGKICGQNHIVMLDSSIDVLSDSINDTIFENIDLYLNGDLTLSNTVKFNGNCYVNGKNRRVILDSDIEIIVGSNSTLAIKNVNIHGLNRNKLRCLDDTGKIILDNVSCMQDGNYSFTVGNLEIKNDVDVSGNYTFYYDCLKTVTIQTDSQMLFHNGITFAIGTQDELVKDRIFYFADNTSKIWIDNANMHIGSGGTQVTKGTLVVGGKVEIEIDSTNTTNGIIFGDGTAQNDMLAQFRPAAYVNFINGHVCYNNASPTKFESMSRYSKLIRGASNTFHIERDMIFSNVSIKVEPTSALTVADGTQVSYENCKLLLPTVKFSINGSRYNTYTTLLDGDEEIFLEEGIFPLYLVVANSGNMVRGNGDITGLITLSGPSAELNLNLDGQITNNISLNEGKVILARDIEFAQNYGFLTSGVVDLSNYNCILGKKDRTCTSDIYWDGNIGELDLNSKLSLSGTWTFSGDCTLNGNNQILLLNSTGQIVVEKGSNLTIKNLTIQGLKDTNIKCLDDLGTVAFDNVYCRQSGDYIFNKGSFDVYNNFELSGAHKFTYQSNQSSNILSKSILYLDRGSIFSYDSGSMDKNLIMFEDDSATLYLNSATLHTTVTGLQLKTGTLVVEGNCYLESETTTATWNDPEGIIIVDEGINFGNNSSAEDFKCDILNDAKLELKKGSFGYKNIKISSLDMGNAGSLLQIDGGTRLKLYQSINAGDGKINFVGACDVYRASGKNILSNINAAGRINYLGLS